MSDIYPPFPLENSYVWQTYGLTFWMGALAVCLIVSCIYFGVLGISRVRSQRSQRQIIEARDRELRARLLSYLDTIDPQESDIFFQLQYIIRDLLSSHFSRDLRSNTIEEITDNQDLGDNFTDLMIRIRDAHYLAQTDADACEIRAELELHIRNLLR